MNIVVERNLSIGLKVFLDKPIWLSFEQELCSESPNSVMSKRIVIVLPNAKLKMPWVILETNSHCLGSKYLPRILCGISLRIGQILWLTFILKNQSASKLPEIFIYEN